MAEKLDVDTYILSYYSTYDPINWKPPRNSAVQLSAAITASARIYMYQFISRNDSYYTDTDYVVLDKPLPNEMVSPTELGKFKLEYEVSEGIFLAPKTYKIENTNNKNVLRHKGAAKAIIDDDWYINQYNKINKIMNVNVSHKFRIQWDKLRVIQKDIDYELRIKINLKRKPVFNNNKWVGSKPIKVKDLGDKKEYLLNLQIQQQKELIDKLNLKIHTLQSNIDDNISKDECVNISKDNSIDIPKDVCVNILKDVCVNIPKGECVNIHYEYILEESNTAEDSKHTIFKDEKYDSKQPIICKDEVNIIKDKANTHKKKKNKKPG
ncbi:DNA polymerase-like [Vicia villosa]|uniref:DNA polymerase-like n=1 Tax=Vicia villosa TaxID=3911 RepID=UPI00273C2E75|nr:DNA polymerase-like [Vicia villosa]